MAALSRRLWRTSFSRRFLEITDRLLQDGFKTVSEEEWNTGGNVIAIHAYCDVTAPRASESHVCVSDEHSRDRARIMSAEPVVPIAGTSAGRRTRGRAERLTITACLSEAR